LDRGKHSEAASQSRAPLQQIVVAVGDLRVDRGMESRNKPSLERTLAKK
jgi:hypothetical protein